MGKGLEVTGERTGGDMGKGQEVAGGDGGKDRWQSVL